MNILICDDEERATRKWHKELADVTGASEGFKIAETSQLAELVESLEDRRERSRDGEIDFEEIDLDNTDVLIVDYDLLRAKDGHLTGETIAYLARCYSRVGIIVALNQFYRDNAFDLSLTSHQESFADLNISDKQLANPGLWTTNWEKGTFRPWYWPIIPDLVQRFAHRVAELKSHLDAPILEFLGFDDEVIDFLTREVLEFIAAGQKHFRAVTFRDFVAPPGQGLRGRDVPANADAIARIAAARVGKWLERSVLVNQDVLVDLPHLAERVPSVAGLPSSLEFLHATTSLPSSMLDSLEKISFAKFQRETWLTRDAWWWPKIELDDELPEIAEPWNVAGLPVVFCEDTSEFVLTERAQLFQSRLPSPYSRRYVSALETVIYRPQVRFAAV